MVALLLLNPFLPPSSSFPYPPSIPESPCRKDIVFGGNEKIADVALARIERIAFGGHGQTQKLEIGMKIRIS